MKALILRDDAEASVACAKILLEKGFQVICVETRHIARALLRIETIDVLVMDERVDGRLTHSVALSAERRLPYISAIMMTDRPGAEADDLFDLIPSLYCLLGADACPQMLAKIALASIENYAEAEARVRRLSAQDLKEAAMDADPIWDAEELAEEEAFADEFVDSVADDFVEENIFAISAQDSVEDTPMVAQIAHNTQVASPIVAMTQQPVGEQSDLEQIALQHRALLPDAPLSITASSSRAAQIAQARAVAAMRDSAAS